MKISEEKKSVSCAAASSRAHSGSQEAGLYILPRLGGTLTETVEVTVMQPCSDIIFHCGDADTGRAHLCRIPLRFQDSQTHTKKNNDQDKKKKSFGLDTKYLKHLCFPTHDFHFGELTTQRPSAIEPPSPGRDRDHLPPAFSNCDKWGAVQTQRDGILNNATAHPGPSP